jgi:RimJ/RimL family protein N-acetyltransferase
LRKHWGKGYASEAAQLFKNYGFQNKLSESIISIIHIDNIPSQQVAIRNGMTKEKQSKWNDLDVFIFRTKL